MSKTIYNEHRYTEKYPDPTAGQAIENIERREKRQRRKKEKRKEEKKDADK